MNRHLQWQVEEGRITQEQADLIENYMKDRAIDRGIAESTMKTRAQYLVLFVSSLPHPVEECSTKDIRLVLSDMRRNYKPNTFSAMLFLVRGFLEWVNPENVDLEAIKKIKAPQKDLITKTAADMLSEEDVKKMLDACGTSRDRALFSVLYEGGFRPIELVRLTWGQVKFDNYGAIINTAEKTGKPRYVRLIMSSPALAAWKSDYLAIIKKDTPVFVKLRGRPPQPITSTTIRRLLEKLARITELDKPIHPYLVRHSHVTHQIEQGIPESIIRLQHWGSLHSRMLATYAHISNDHIDQVLFEKAGVTPPKEKREPVMKPSQCHKCKTINIPGARYCNTCGQPLTADAEGEVKDISEQVHELFAENPKAQDIFLKLIKELNK